MAKTRPSYVHRKIRRLEREIASIDDLFYLTEKHGAPAQHASMLERKRDDMIRAAVLQFHTSIEDILDSQIICHILGVPAHQRMRLMRTSPGKALRKLLSTAGSIGFDRKLDLAVGLRIISEKRRERLAVLNTLRN